MSATNGSQNNSTALNGTGYQGFQLFGDLDVEKHATLVAIILAIIIFLLERVIEYKKNKDDINDRVSRIHKTVMKEIDDAYDTLNNSFYQPVDHIAAGLSFKGAILNTDAYESLLHSGLFTYFRPDTQNTLANFYTRIKLHNDLQRERLLLRSQFLLDKNFEKDSTTWQSVIATHDNLLQHYQIDIKNTLSSVKDILNKDTGQL
jgi:hypothetical protein